MRRLITILAVLAALYFAYDYFVTKGGENPFRLPAPRPVPTGETLRREPGRGLNPFVTDEVAPPPQRPAMPDAPGAP